MTDQAQGHKEYNTIGIRAEEGEEGTELHWLQSSMVQKGRAEALLQRGGCVECVHQSDKTDKLQQRGPREARVANASQIIYAACQRSGIGSDQHKIYRSGHSLKEVCCRKHL